MTKARQRAAMEAARNFRARVRRAVGDAYDAQERKTVDPTVKAAVHEALWHMASQLCPDLGAGPKGPTVFDVLRMARQIERSKGYRPK